MRTLLTATIIAMAAAPGIAGPVGSTPPPISNRPLTDQQMLTAYQAKLKPLRAEILARKAAEGGQLTAASQAEFQSRLDRLNTEFRRFVKKQDVQGYDAWGDREG